MHPWTRSSAFVFAVAVCAFNWTIFLVVAFGSGGTISIPSLHFSVSTWFILPVYASLLPALYCLLAYRESHASIWKLRASFAAYGTGIVLGLIPFVKYLVHGNPPFPWGLETAIRFTAQFVAQIFLVTIWDEIIWRGCFLRKIRSFASAGSAILLMSVIYTFWQGGLILLYYREGTPAKLVLLLPLIYFCAGVMFGSLFEISEGSLWPCILAHSVFDASARDYYVGPVRTNQAGSYVAELVLLAFAAFILFWIVTRRSRRSVLVQEHVAVKQN